MRTLYKATVGSTLHGLSTPESDLDVREVYARDARDMLNLFHKEQPENTPGGDYERYEVGKFVQMCVKGNPTALEILFSSIYEMHDNEFAWLKLNKSWFIDSKAVRAAHMGYIDASIKTLRSNQSNMRKRKAYIAGERIFSQGWALLHTGTFNPRLSDDLIADLMPIKMLGDSPLSDEKIADYFNALYRRIEMLKDAVPVHKFTPNTDAIMESVYAIWGV